MKNPLVETVENELKDLGIDGAHLLAESFHAESFGNAEAVYELGGVRLRFVRDRGQDGVDVIIPGSTEGFIFEDVSLALGWQKLDEIVSSDEQIDFDDPPPGPIALNLVLEYIKNGILELQNAFSKDNIAETLDKLRDAQAKRTKAMFG